MRTDEGHERSLVECVMMSLEESSSILGVSLTASREEIVAARRRLARRVHPDTGGNHTEMALINEAFRVLISLQSSGTRTAPGSSGVRRGDGTETHRSARNIDTDRRTSRTQRRRSFRDAPSFVVNALPVDAFEILVVAASVLGEVVDEDPPYFLEVLVREPGPVWCRFELLPDAGSTTVCLSCDVESGYRVYSPEEIRDLWIATINA